MADCSPACSQQASEVNALNSKLAYDFAAQLQNQGLVDNQGSARAWESLRLKTAIDAQTLSALSQANAVISAQVSNIETQQTTSPVRTGTADAIVGGVGVSAEQVAANVANLATTMTPIIAGAVAEAVSTAITAILPALITAVGGASTPSQTKGPTTGSAA